MFTRLVSLALLLSACTGTLDSGGPDASTAVDSSAQDLAPARERAQHDQSSTPDQGADAAPVADLPPAPDQAPKPDQAPPPDQAAKPDSRPTAPPPLDLNKVVWLHTNVAGWKVTAKLSSVTFKGSQICLNHDKAGAWPTNKINSTVVSANPWVFVWRQGKWYGATWEWMRPGQTCKNKSSVAGDHIKQKPFDAASGWKPSSGQTLYFMVSGLARMPSITNVKQRSKPVKVVWP